MDDPRSKKKAPTQEQEEEQELEKKTEAQQEQKRDAAQDALGNQEVASMLGLGGQVRAGEAGLGTDTVRRQESEKDGVDYGGDDDAGPDAPIEMEDLVRSWNPGTRRGEEAAKFVEQLPTGRLIDEDEALLAELAADPVSVRPRPPGIHLSAEVVVHDPTLMVRAAGRLSNGDLLHRAWLAALTPLCRALVDPHGRLVVARARLAATVALVVEDALRGGPAAEDTLTFGASALELATRGHWIEFVNEEVRASETKLPSTATLVRPTLDGWVPRAVRGHSPSVEVIEHVRALLDDLAPHAPGASWLASLPATLQQPAVDDDDDPLGLDALVASLTGAAVDPNAGVYDALLDSAEKLAAACARTKTDAAAFVLAVADVSGDRTSPQLLLQVAEQIDQEVTKVLQLLVEIARAIRQRAVPPPGVRNGLKRAAKGLDLAFGQIAGWVAGGLVACAEVSPSVELPPLTPNDPLAEALHERRPADALPFLRSRAHDDEGRAALLFLRAVAGETTGLAPEALALAEALRPDRPAVSAGLELVALGAMQSTGDELGASELARDLADRAWDRGDDLVLAVAYQHLIDVAAEPLEVQRTAVRRASALGPGAGRTLLLRHEMPET